MTEAILGTQKHHKRPTLSTVQLFSPSLVAATPSATASVVARSAAIRLSWPKDVKCRQITICYRYVLSRFSLFFRVSVLEFGQDLVILSSSTAEISEICLPKVARWAMAFMFSMIWQKMQNSSKRLIFAFSAVLHKRAFFGTFARVTIFRHLPDMVKMMLFSLFPVFSKSVQIYRHRPKRFS